MSGTVSRHIRQAADRLRENGGTARDASRTAKLLMQHLLNTDAAGIISQEERELDSSEVKAFQALVERAMEEPVHRILGWREFHGLRLAVTPATLEPRDDTETLVDLVLSQLRSKERSWRFADLGTGTGAVALALLWELPNATVVATDIDPDALAVARDNAEANGFSDRFETSCGNWFDAVAEPFDFIVSNPPYIPSAAIETLHPHVRDHDPRDALDGGEDGLNAYRTILAGAAIYLEPGGFLAFEIGHDQAGAVSAIALAQDWTTTSVRRDLAGKNRALLISR